MKIRLKTRPLTDSKMVSSVVSETPKKNRRHGPQPKYGGERMNFLPGTKLRTAIQDLSEEAKRDFKLTINASYILREGAFDQIKKLRLLFRQARKGELGPKKRETLFHDLTAV